MKLIEVLGLKKLQYEFHFYVDTLKHLPYSIWAYPLGDSDYLRCIGQFYADDDVTHMRDETRPGLTRDSGFN